MATNLKMPNKKTTIAIAVAIAVLLIIAITGTVVFLKDKGRTEAAELETAQQENKATTNEQTSNIGKTEEKTGLQTQNQDQQENQQQTSNTAVQEENSQTTIGNISEINTSTGTTRQEDNIQETTIERVEKIEIPELVSKELYVGWTPMELTASLASSKIDVNIKSIETTKRILGVNSKEIETEKFIEVNPQEFYVKEGDFIKYEIKATNTGDIDLEEINMTDDRQVTLCSVTVPQGMNKDNIEYIEYEANSNLVEGLTGKLKPSETITIEVIYQVKREDVLNAEKLVNIATSSAKDTNPDSSEEVIINVTSSPKIEIEKTALKINGKKIKKDNIKEIDGVEVADIKVNKCDEITYKLTVKNTGNVTINNVNITDTRDVTYKGKKYKAGSSLLGKNGITLEPEESKTITVKYTVKQEDLDEQNEDNTLINYATVTGKYEGKDITPDTDDAIVTEVDAAPILKSKKKVNVGNNTAVNIGEQITYTIEVKNEGTAKAVNVLVEDYVPEGTTLVSKIKTEKREDGFDWMKWEIPEIEVGETEKISFKVKVNNSALGTTITNTGKVNEENTNTITNTTKKSINIYEVETETQGQKAVVVIDMSLSMAAAVSTDDSDIMAYSYDTTRWYYLKDALDQFIDEFLSNDKNQVAIVGYNSSATTLVNYTNSKEKAKKSYRNVFTETHFNNVVAAVEQSEEGFNGQNNKLTEIYESNDEYNIDVDGLTYMSTGKWSKTVEGTTAIEGETIEGATITEKCKLASGTNITEGLSQANNILGNGKVEYTNVVLMTDGEDNRSSDEEISEQARKIHRKDADLYTIGFSDDEETLIESVGEENITESFEATNSSQLYEAFEKIADEITTLPKVEKITDENGNIDLSEYEDKNISSVIIYKGKNDSRRNRLKEYTGEEFKATLEDGKFDVATFINETVSGKVSEKDTINIEIIVDK